MADMKYIIAGIDVVVFANHITHRDMAQRMNYHPAEIMGAGFVGFDMYGNPQCHGRAESLAKESRGDTDSKTIARHMREPTRVTAEEYYEELIYKAKCWDRLEANCKTMMDPPDATDFIKGAMEAAENLLDNNKG